MRNIALYALAALFISASLGQGVAQAQYTAVPIMAPAPTTFCVNIAYNLRSGSKDYYTNGAVTQLQQFLVGQGYFNSAYLGTGSYGPLTARAVAQYQTAHGVSPIGITGPATRAAIYAQTCGGVVVPPTETAPVMYWLSPTSGAVGAQVSVTGYGFTSNNTILMDGSVVASGVPISSSMAVACTTDPSCRGGIRQTLVFTVPAYLAPNCAPNMMCAMYMRSVTDGQYQISVQNQNGTSNTQTFAVTSGGGSQALSINGLDAPSTLPLGTPGTWTVKTTSGSTNSTLHYSVVWGDEGATTGASIMAPAPTSIQNSASFTQAYSRAGTYTPVFTVVDDAGRTASVRGTVIVTPLY